IAIVPGSAEPDASRGAVEQCIAGLGAPQILVNNVGVSAARAWITDVPIEGWDRVLAVNVRGPALYCKHVLPHMLEQRYGRIVSIAHGAGVRPNPQALRYSASK